MTTTHEGGGPGRPSGCTLDRTIALLRERADDLRARGVLHASVFGSVARREDGPGSDLDLVVEVGPDVGTLDIMVIEEILAKEVGRTVQTITKSGLDAVRHADVLRDMTLAF